MKAILDSRVGYDIHNGRYWFLDGSSFPATDEGMQELIGHANAFTQAVDARLGRKASPMELLSGAKPIEDESTADSIKRQSEEFARSQPTKFDKNPYDVALSAIEKKPTFKQHLNQLRDQWNESAEAKAAQAAKSADPKRQKAIDLAAAAVRDLRFDPNATTTSVRKANELLALATEGDLAEFKARYNDEYIGPKRQRTEAAIEARKASIAELQALQSQIQGFEEAPALPTPIHVAEIKPVETMSAEDFSRARARYLEQEAKANATREQRLINNR